MATFSSAVKATPGACSPSRSVVSLSTIGVGREGWELPRPGSADLSCMGAAGGSRSPLLRIIAAAPHAGLRHWFDPHQLNDLPQPHLETALGLSKVNPELAMPRTKST